MNADGALSLQEFMETGRFSINGTRYFRELFSEEMICGEEWKGIEGRGVRERRRR